MHETSRGVISGARIGLHVKYKGESTRSLSFPIAADGRHDCLSIGDNQNYVWAMRNNNTGR